MPSRQSGVPPTHLSGGWRTRLHGLHARSMRTTRLPAERGPYRRGSDSPNTATTGVRNGVGQMHRAGVARHQQIQPFENRRQRDQIESSAQIQHLCIGRKRRAHAADGLLVLCRSGQDDGGASFPEQPRADFGKPLERPLLDGTSASDMHSHERALQSAKEIERAVPRRIRRRQTLPARIPERRQVTFHQRIHGRGEGLGHEAKGIGGRVEALVEVFARGEQGTAAAVVEAHAVPRARQAQERVTPHVGFEIDAELIAAIPPAHGSTRGFSKSHGLIVASQPRQVEGLHAIDAGNERAEIAIPAADGQVDLGARRQLSNRRDGGQRHQQIADAFEPEEQDAHRVFWRIRREEDAFRRGQEAQPPVGRRDEAAFAGIIDVGIAWHGTLPLYGLRATT